jgi:hypothetical protein
MSLWPGAIAPALALGGADGELVSVRVSADPRLLEDLLECLACVSFPINPQLYHGMPTVVEFPAYRSKLFEVYDALRVYGFNPAESVRVASMIESIST